MPRTHDRHGRSRAGTVAVTLAVIFAVGVVAQPVQADDSYYDLGQNTPRPTIYPYSYNSTWQIPLDRAITNWNNTYSPVLIAKSTGGVSRVYAQSYADTWFGLYTSCHPDNCMYISMNARTISASATNFANFVTSVAVHEYGHSFKLAHRDGQDSIMNRQRARNTMVGPSLSDVNNVRNYYPGWPLG